VSLVVRRSDLAYWDVRVDGWVVEGGRYVLEVGASSRDLRTSTYIDIDSDAVSFPISMESSFEEVLADPSVGPELQAAVDAQFGGQDDVVKLLANFPVGRLDGFPLPRAEILALVEKAARH
jgi:beta-glucosidase